MINIITKLVSGHLHSRTGALSRRLIVAPKAEDRASDSGDVRIGKADMAGTCVK